MIYFDLQTCCESGYIYNFDRGDWRVLRNTLDLYQTTSIYIFMTDGRCIK